MKNKLKITDPNITKLLYQLIYDMHSIFNDNNLEYWAIGGTLLGSVRNSGIIPWDDDGDVGIHHKDIKKFLSLRDIFKKCGYTIRKDLYGYKIFYTNRKKIKDQSFSYPFVDVFPFKKIDGKLRLSVKEARDIWPKEVWSDSELLPLKFYKFGNYYIKGPNKYKQYFEGLYGKDWNDVAYREFDHETLDYIDKVKVKINKSMRTPAEPFDKVIKNKKCFNVDQKYDNNFIVKMPVYVIACTGPNKRYDKFLKSAQKAGMETEKINCVNGRKFTDEFICYLKDKGYLAKNADMTKVEVAINMSHFICWETLVNSDYDYMLICESDVEFHKDFVKKVNEILYVLNHNDIPFSILHLFNGNWAKTLSKCEKIIRVDKDILILKETVEYNAGAACYILSKSYAKYLINHFFPIKMPQDILMGSFPKKGNHLTLKMKYDKKQSCYISPLIDLECGGEGGTGAHSTQDYNGITVDNIKCKNVKM
jgi:phosphorylcholine metabolism protein LicD/GR25 family glycosyltransferase involved in LPS biosynthesis